MLEVTDDMLRIVEEPFYSSYFKTRTLVQPVCALRTEKYIKKEGLNEGP